MAKARVILSWSSGKDSAWTLQTLREQGDIEICALLTTFNAAADRVAMHAVRRELVRQQAIAAALPLIEIDLPCPCSNDDYEKLMRTTVPGAAMEYRATHVAFGDLFLEDIRNYRQRQMRKWGLKPLFPLWGKPTGALAREMISGGLKAHITCVDPSQLDGGFAGRALDLGLLDALPATVDPCGENGEFHTFAWDGPMFDAPVPVILGETVARDGFVFADLAMAESFEADQSRSTI
jgi:uncharacterized protein (TIGR00290 family)